MAKKYVVTILLEGKDRNLKKSLQEGGVAVEEFADTAESGGKRIEQAFTGAAIAMTFGKSIPIMKEAIGLYMQSESAAAGLDSALRAVGEDAERGRAKMREYVADGLIPVTQASAALKNLLLGGWGLEQAMEILRVFKDYAAYGRQGQLTIGEAIERATQGLKQELSTLTDNVGWSTNLKDTWQVLAKEIDKGVGSLTRAERNQAVYNAIMREGVVVQGDAAKASSQLTGEVARQDARIRELYESVGQALVPAHKKLLGVLGPVTENIRAFALVNPEATATLLAGAGLVAAVGALAAAFALMGQGGALVVGVTAGILGIATAVNVLRSKLHPSNEALAQAAREANDTAAQVRNLRDEYVELKGKPDKSAEEHGRLRDVMEELARLVPEAVKAFGDEGEILDLNTSSLTEYVRAMEIVRDMNIEEYEKRAAEAQREREEVQARLSAKIAAYDSMLKHGIESTKEFTGTVVEGGEELYSMNEEMVSSTVSVDDLQRQIRSLAAELRDAEEEEKRTKRTLRELRGETEDATDATDDLNEATEKAAKAAREASGGIRVWDQRLADFFDRHGGLPTTLQEWIALFKAFKKEVLGAGEATEQAEKDLDSFEAKLKRATQGWGDWGQFGVNAIVGVTDTFGTMLGLMMSGSEDITERLQELWGHFFEWIMIELGKLIAQLAAMQILKAIFPNLNLFGAEGGTVTRAAGGGRLLRAQGGGQIGGTVPGLDRYPVLAQLDETFLSTDLTRRIERMVSDYESSRMTPAFAGVGGAREIIEKREYNFTIVSPDAATFRRMIRSGEMGREIKLAEDHGKLPRR